MITQKIVGGLGNQMFQYAYIKALSLRNNIPFSLDISSFESYTIHQYGLEYFDINKKYCLKSKIPFYERMYTRNIYINFLLMYFKGVCKKINPNHNREKQFNFDRGMVNIKRGYIEGYFQTEKYFKEFGKEIRDDFQFISVPSLKNKETIKKINSCNAVSVHIRRGDYISNSANAFYNVCDIPYYNKAIAMIKTKVTDPFFFFFSDDIQRVKENIKMDDNAHYVDRNHDDASYEDMRLMSLCKHNIIANSSFSWRGAWLNNNKAKIVIAPARWFSDNKRNYSDVVPEKWIKI